MHFRALAIAAEALEDLGSFVVVLAERHDGGGRRLELQRALEVDPQDVERGEDTYCLVTEECAVYYGGVIAWSLVDKELKLELTPEAASVLGVDGGFSIALEADAATIERLREGLRTVLSDSVARDTSVSGTSM